MRLNEFALNGKTIVIETYARTTKVKPSNVKEWLEAGYEYFKQDENGDKFMIGGIKKGKPRYVCINFCKVSIV